MNMKKLLSLLLALLVLISGVALMEDAAPGTIVEAPEATDVEEAAVEEIVPVEAQEPEDEETAAEEEPGEPISAAAVDDVVAEETSDLVEIAEIIGEDVVNDEPQMATLTSADFPDSAFWSYLVSNFDTDGDGTLSSSEVNAITEIEIPKNTDISSLEGVKKLTALKILKCTECSLTALDINGCTNLTRVDCYSNKLTTLNVNGCVNLSVLDCGENKLTTLDVSSCTELSQLYCDSNKLTSLDVTRNMKLIALWCKGQLLTSLDVTRNTELEGLYCEENNITSLDLTNCSKLIESVSKSSRIVSSDGKTVRYERLYGDDPEDTYTVIVLSFDASVNVNLAKAIVTPTPTPVVTPTPTTTPAPVVTPAPTVEPGSSASNPLTIVSTKTSTKSKAYVGKYYQIDLYGKNGSGFKSSNKKIATVSKTGLVTPKKAGKVKITFKVAKKKRTVTLTVLDPTIPTKVYLNLKGTVAAKVGVPQTLTATLNAGAVSGLKWTSSNKKIATVKNGVVTFKKNGTVTITVTTVKGNKKAKVKFKVTK